MIPSCCLFLAPLLSSDARAHESEAQPMVLSDIAELYNGSEYDTGWLPGDSAIQVRFQIASEGGAWVGMEGEGELSWPEALTLGFQPYPDTGEILVDASLNAISSVRFDVVGYEWESELDRRTVAVDGGALFRPFLLEGADPSYVEVDFTGREEELVAYDLDVFTGVSLVFDVSLYPDATTSFDGQRWEVGGDSILDEGGTAVVVPSGLGEQAVEASFVGRWQSTLDLVLNPTASVCVSIFGCWEVLGLEIPIGLAADDFEQAFPVTALAFPLPVLETEVETYDFGEVLVGSVANLELPISNGGQLDLEGTVGHLGSPWFSSYPEYFLAGPGREDGVVVTFAPEGEGPVSATLLLESNDPLVPVREIELTGVGVLPEEESGLDGGDGVQEEGAASDGVSEETKVGGCGCSSAPQSWSGALGALMALGLLRRRRT